MIDELIEEMQKLKEAKELLYQVYLEHGPYGDGEIPQELRWKINNFFGFDDSEQEVVMKEVERKLQLAQQNVAKIAEANRILGNDKVADELAYSAKLIKKAREEIAKK